MTPFRSAAAVMLFAAACAPRPSSSAAAGKSDSAAGATAPPVQALPPAPPVMRAVPGSGENPADSLVGTWDFGPPSGLRGPQLTIIIDSARGPRFYGRLTRALSGDVEITTFEPFIGELDAGGTARMTIRFSGKDSPVTEIAGRVHGDTWTGTRLRWGGDELAEGRTWQGRRVR